MNYTSHTFSDKKLAALSIGCMRFPSREAAAAVIHTCADRGVVYLDTSPMYCYRSEEENAETWTGAAIAGQRDRYILSAKCATGNGGNEVGEYDPAHGFSITTADQVRRQIEQSMRRLQVDHLDCYQLWAVHSPALLDVALKPGGWLEGVLKAKEEGLIDHLGVTGHADGAEIKRWVDSGWVEMVTVPFNIMNTERLDGLLYARDKGVAVICMNPLAGGFLGAEGYALSAKMADLGIQSAVDLALRYVASHHGFSALGGMTSAQQAEQNCDILSGELWSEAEAESLAARFDELVKDAPHFCTGCGYCLPCSVNLDIPGILRLRNYNVVFDLESARSEYRGRARREANFDAANCTACGDCESRCPNSLPVASLMAEVVATMARP